MFSSAADAHDLKVRIHDLRSSKSLGYGAIAREVGCTKAYVQQVLNGKVSAPSSVSPADVLVAALAIKSDDLSLGSVQVLARLSSSFSADSLPSQSTLERLFELEKLTNKVLHFSTGSRAYWHEDRPIVPCDRWEIDTQDFRFVLRTFYNSDIFMNRICTLAIILPIIAAKIHHLNHLIYGVICGKVIETRLSAGRWRHDYQRAVYRISD